MQFMFSLWVCAWSVCVCVCLCLLSPSTMSALAKESCPLHPDSCSLNKEEWTWIFLNCTHIHRLSVLQRTPAIPTPSGETSVLSGLWHFSYTLPVIGDSTQLRELTQNKAKLPLRTRCCILSSFKAWKVSCQPASTCFFLLFICF